jgi:thiamine-monophosphate kinase
MADRHPTESAEDRLIARYFKPLARHPAALGFNDDAAAIAPPPGCDLVLKTDGVIVGVHVFADDPPDAIARKALRMNLSDLAAKGATPLGFLMSIALPTDVPESWVAQFAKGLAADADHYGCPLLGGDTDRTPGPAAVNVFAFGTVPHGRMVLRGGAKPGDRVVVTGSIGDAALGLALRRDASLRTRWRLDPRGHDHLAGRYLLPQPRNAIADILRDHASGAMDVSDGLAGDFAKLCRASGVAGEIEVARVPLSDAARAALAADPAVIETILTGGDDYEILAAMPAAKVAPFREAAAAAGVAVAEIGAVTAGEGACLLDGSGRALSFAHPSYSHF